MAILLAFLAGSARRRREQQRHRGEQAPAAPLPMRSEAAPLQLLKSSAFWQGRVFSLRDRFCCDRVDCFGTELFRLSTKISSELNAEKQELSHHFVRKNTIGSIHFQVRNRNVSEKCVCD